MWHEQLNNFHVIMVCMIINCKTVPVQLGWDGTNERDLDTSLESTDGSSIWEVLLREDSSRESLVVWQLSLVSSASDVSPSLVESSVSSLEHSTEEMLSLVVSNAVVASSPVWEVLSTREEFFLRWKPLSKRVDSSARELSSSTREDFSRTELSSILEGVVKLE